MFTKIYTTLQIIPAGQVLVIGMIAILAIATITGVIWMQTDQVIAPPALRVLDWLWRMFICQYSV